MMHVWDWLGVYCDVVVVCVDAVVGEVGDVGV